MNTHRVITGVISVVLGIFVGPKTSATEVIDLNNSPQPVVITSSTGSQTLFFFQPIGSGTGVIDPFLSIQASPTEQGFNVSSGDLDTKRDGQYTRTQQIQDWTQKVMISGVEYFSFTLDVNESNTASKTNISIDSIRIYTSSTLLSGADWNGTTLVGAALTYDLDTFNMNGDTTLLYNDFQSGSGVADIGFLIPVSAFVGLSPTTYVYMYQQFGNYVDGVHASDFYNSEGGFEETKNELFVIPETGAIFPLLAVLGVVVAGPFVRRCFHP